MSDRTRSIFEAIHGPRRATQLELAQELGISQQAVSWHLRRAMLKREAQRRASQPRQQPRARRIRPVSLSVCGDV